MGDFRNFACRDHLATIKFTCLVAITLSSPFAYAGIMEVSYRGLASANNPNVTPASVSQGFNTLQPSPVGVELTEGDPIEPSGIRSTSSASLSSFFSGNPEDGLLFGSTAAGVGDFSSGGTLRISETAATEGFSQIGIIYDIYDGAISLNNAAGNERGSVEFRFNVGGIEIFNASVDLFFDAASGVSSVNANAGAQALNGFNITQGENGGVSWGRTRGLLVVTLEDNSLFDNLDIETSLTTSAGGTSLCDGARIINCNGVSTSFDDPGGRNSRRVAYRSNVPPDQPFIPPNFDFDFGSALNINGDGGSTITPLPGGGGNPIPVPEPSTMALLALGLISMVGMRSRKRLTGHHSIDQ